MNIKVIGADVHVTPTNSNVDGFIPLKGGRGSTIEEINDELENGLEEMFEAPPLFDAVICANGGFAMDDDDDDDEDDTGGSADNMMETNYYPVVAASQLLPFITPHAGLFIAFGAVAALAHPSDEDSPMQQYIQSKDHVHSLIQNMGSVSGKAMHKSKKQEVIQLMRKYKCLPALTAVAILPSTLDTEMNRQVMNPSQEDLEGWTRLEDVAGEIGRWMMMEDLRPFSGSLVKCVTKGGKTDFVISR